MRARKGRTAASSAGKERSVSSPPFRRRARDFPIGSHAVQKQSLTGHLTRWPFFVTADSKGVTEGTPQAQILNGLARTGQCQSRIQKNYPIASANASLPSAQGSGV